MYYNQLQDLNLLIFQLIFPANRVLYRYDMKTPRKAYMLFEHLVDDKIISNGQLEVLRNV